jgi:hypothetical protein
VDDGGEEDEEEKDMGKGGSVAGIVVASSPPSRNTVLEKVLTTRMLVRPRRQMRSDGTYIVTFSLFGIPQDIGDHPKTGKSSLNIGNVSVLVRTAEQTNRRMYQSREMLACSADHSL